MIGRSHGDDITGEDFRHILTFPDAFDPRLPVWPRGQDDLLLCEGDSDWSLRAPGARHGHQEVSLEQDLVRVDVGAVWPPAHGAMIRSFQGPDLGMNSLNLT